MRCCVSCLVSSTRTVSSSTAKTGCEFSDTFSIYSFISMYIRVCGQLFICRYCIIVFHLFTNLGNDCLEQTLCGFTCVLHHLSPSKIGCYEDPLPIASQTLYQTLVIGKGSRCPDPAGNQCETGACCVCKLFN